MDDERFDDIIKQKVGNYEATEFDPYALAALHHKMTGLRTWPWYSRYKTELLIASGMAMCTLMIGGSQWYFTKNESDLLKQHSAEVLALREQLKNLTQEILIIKKAPPDTVYISESKSNEVSSSSLLLSRHIQEIELALDRTQKAFSSYQLASAHRPSDNTAQDQSSYIADDESQNSSRYFDSKRVSPKSKQSSSVFLLKNDGRGIASPKKELSVETLRALENHYRNGIGIRLGPNVELSHGFYDQGSSKFDYAGGVLADFILSPAFSIETGGRFLHRAYEISEEKLTNSKLPNVDHTLGPLLNAEVDSWMVELPLNIKYRYPINKKASWLGSFGYSFQIFTRQIFEYEYGVDGNPAARLSTSSNISDMKMYPGVLNISIGLGHQLKNKKILETSLFYQHGLGEAGLEKANASFIGLRSTYWFIIK